MGNTSTKNTDYYAKRHDQLIKEWTDLSLDNRKREAEQNVKKILKPFQQQPKQKILVNYAALLIAQAPAVNEQDILELFTQKDIKPEKQQSMLKASKELAAKMQLEQFPKPENITEQNCKNRIRSLYTKLKVIEQLSANENRETLKNLIDDANQQPQLDPLLNQTFNEAKQEIKTNIVLTNKRQFTSPACWQQKKQKAAKELLLNLAFLGASIASILISGPGGAVATAAASISLGKSVHSLYNNYQQFNKYKQQQKITEKFNGTRVNLIQSREQRYTALTEEANTGTANTNNMAAHSFFKNIAENSAIEPEVTTQITNNDTDKTSIVPSALQTTPKPLAE